MGVAVGLLVDLCNCNKAASVSTMDCQLHGSESRAAAIKRVKFSRTRQW